MNINGENWLLFYYVWNIGQYWDRKKNDSNTKVFCETKRKLWIFSFHSFNHEALLSVLFGRKTLKTSVYVQILFYFFSAENMLVYFQCWPWSHSDYELAEAVPTSWYQLVYSLALFVAPVLYFAIFLIYILQISPLAESRWHSISAFYAEEESNHVVNAPFV